MSEKKHKVPKLRFPGFTGDWELRKLGDVIDRFEYGLNAAATEYDGVHKYIRITDIDDVSHMFLKSNLTTPKIDFQDADTEMYKLKEGDILFARTGASVGKTYLYDINDGDLYFAGFLIRGHVNPSNNAKFVYQNTLTENYDLFIKITSQRSGQPGVNSKEYAEFKLYIPSKEEQEKISLVLTDFDNLIILHQRKLESLKLKKKALLQKLFPKNGEQFPELRFPGFTDAWEQRKLGDYLSIPIKEQLEVNSSNDLLTVKLNLGGVELGANRDTLSLGSTTYYKRLAGQFIYGKQNFFNGSMGIIPEELDGKGSSGDVPSLNISNILPEFLYTYVSRESYWRPKEASASGTGSKRIHEATLLSFDIAVPDEQEQKLIATCMNGITNLITLHQRKLEHLQLQKKALLQQMFV